MKCVFRFFAHTRNTFPVVRAHAHAAHTGFYFRGNGFILTQSKHTSHTKYGI